MNPKRACMGRTIPIDSFRRFSKPLPHDAAQFYLEVLDAIKSVNIYSTSAVDIELAVERSDD